MSWVSPPSPQQSLLPRVHVVFFGAIAAAIIVLLLANFEDLQTLLPSSFWSISSKPATSRTSHTTVRVEKRPISIGEDCNDDATKCQYFYPVRFLRQWRNDAIARHKRDGRKRSATAPLDRCYKNMISLYNLRCREEFVRGDRCRARAYSYASSYNETTRALDLPLQFGYKKLYKTGGTAIDEILRKIKYRGKSMALQTFRPIKPEHNLTAAHDFMRWVAHTQHQEGLDYPVITIVRDVVPRFVSAANQLVGMKGRLQKCGSATMDTRTLMECVVSALINGHRDPHFESLVADINCNVGGQHDVRFSLYSMEDVSEVLEALGSKNSAEKINSSNEKNITLTIADLNIDLIQKICRWYAADVAMMRSLGFKVSHCA
mmetsp:Transcript_26523/g.76576  ORF Transcript_26523/g.76576 Transcript_26523/m.76576 type:complete len:375 (-) Transcript_26523:35-1159(-)